MTMRLILVRHGETNHNRGGVTLGRADEPLNARGRLQARAVAAAFRTPPAAIYSSPLSRCRETADAIARATRARVTIDDRLIEMDVGELEHLTRDELRVRYPQFLRTWMGEGAADARMPGGETLVEVQERAWAAVEAIRAAHQAGTVVAVSHNFVMRMLVCRALNLPIGDFRRFGQAVASMSVLDFGERGITVARVNEISHLIGAGLADDP